MYLKAVAFFGIMCVVSVATILGVAFYNFEPSSPEKNKGIGAAVAARFFSSNNIIPVTAIPANDERSDLYLDLVFFISYALTRTTSQLTH